MRKKSHISLANGLMKCFDEKSVSRHRLTFCVASIWPDCRPSFITTPHSIDKTYDMVKGNIEKLLERNKDKGSLSTKTTAHIGVILHYIADYFTFPHNKEYTGNIKDHVYYEKYLKYAIREYIRSGKASYHKEQATILSSPAKLFEHIDNEHSTFINTNHTMESDVEYIVRMCTDVFVSLIYMLGIHEDNILERFA